MVMSLTVVALVCIPLMALPDRGHLWGLGQVLRRYMPRAMQAQAKARHRVISLMRRARAAGPAGLTQHLLAPVRRVFLRACVSGKGLDDVTVIIALRNRLDHRLRNTLMSLRGQTYRASLITILVVDYGSDLPGAIDQLSSTCRDYNAIYIRVEGSQHWCKSHCLNIGIRRATSKYVLISDVDIMFTQDYIADAVALVRVDTVGVVYSVCRDLQETDALTVLSDHAPLGPQLDELAARTMRRFAEPSYGICLTRRLYFNVLHGYDEAYVGWGAEDADIAKRFRYLGLSEMILTGSSYYLHQWHPKWEGIRALPHLKSLIIANANYLNKTHSIVRNRGQWGVADASVHM